MVPLVETFSRLLVVLTLWEPFQEPRKVWVPALTCYFSLKYWTLEENFQDNSRSMPNWLQKSSGWIPEDLQVMFKSRRWVTLPFIGIWEPFTWGPEPLEGISRILIEEVTNYSGEFRNLFCRVPEVFKRVLEPSGEFLKFSRRAPETWQFGFRSFQESSRTISQEFQHLLRRVPEDFQEPFKKVRWVNPSPVLYVVMLFFLLPHIRYTWQPINS